MKSGSIGCFTALPCSLVLALSCTDGSIKSRADGAAEAPTWDASRGAVDPGELFGKSLTLWLDADDSTSVEFDQDAGDDAGVVVRWLDRRNLQYGGSVHYGSLPRSAVRRDARVANGHYAIRVGPSRGVFDVHTSWYYLGPVLSTVVISYTNIPADEAIVYRGAADQTRLMANWNGAAVVAGGVGPELFPTPRGALGDGGFHVITFRCDGTQVWMRVDGVEAMHLATKVGCYMNPLRIAGDYVPAYTDGGFNAPERLVESLDGYVAEMIFVSGTAGTPLELSDLGAYIQRKYGIPF